MDKSYSSKDVENLECRQLSDYKQKIVLESVLEFMKTRRGTTKDYTIFEYQSHLDKFYPLYKEI